MKASALWAAVLLAAACAPARASVSFRVSDHLPLWVEFGL